jgi:hypothetical protein
MTPRSPFQYNRWETDDDHIIWLPEDFHEWERKPHVYFTGLRGSGKTTLLRAFEWSERLTNKSLREQLGSDPFANRYIGVYLNTPSYITRQFSDWPLRRENMDNSQWEEEKARLYSLYLEYQILQLFVEAIQGLRISRILKFSIEDEYEAIKKILSERPEIDIFLQNRTTDPGLNDIRLCFKFMHENIRSCVIKKKELVPDKGYPTLQMGKMLEEITECLLRLCSRDEDIKSDYESQISQTWLLKVCIDQTESIDLYQLKAINTMVAGLDKGVVSFIIASLNDNNNITDNFIPHHPLTYADRMHVSLEDVYGTPSNFFNFIASVTNLRFKKYTGNDDISVDLRNLLGDWNLNALLYNFSIKRSEKEKVRAFIERSKENVEKDFFKNNRALLVRQHQEAAQESPHKLFDDKENLDTYLPEEGIGLDVPPLYQTYLIEKLKIIIPQKEDENYKIRPLKSTEFRKKMVAAMLCLCKEYGITVPYAGIRMVISMSDRSIRDFLLLMHEIYMEENISADKFAGKRINPSKQHKAIFKASGVRYERIGKEAEARTREITRLVNSLGKVTAEIQSAYSDPASLGAVERGIFDIDLSGLSMDERDDLKEIIKLASDCHSIKIVDRSIGRSIDRISIRLHKLLAPKFVFSYRGAYYNVPIKGDILLNLCKERDEAVAEKITDRIIHKIVKDDISKIDSTMTLDRWST